MNKVKKTIKEKISIQIGKFVFFILILHAMIAAEFSIIFKINRVYSLEAGGEYVFDSTGLGWDIALCILLHFIIFSLVYISFSRRLKKMISNGLPHPFAFTFFFNIVIIVLFFVSLELPFRIADKTFARKVEPHFKLTWERLTGKDFEIAKPPDTYRIIIIGDSSIFGLISRADMVPSRQLKKLLDNQFPAKRFEVINGAIPGSPSSDGVSQLKTGLMNYQPELVIIGYNNDSDLGPFVQIKEVKNSLPGRLWIFLWDNSRVFRIISDTYAQFKDKNPLQPIVSVMDSEKNYNQMIDIVRDSGADVVLVSMPEFLPDPKREYIKLSPEYREVIQKVALKRDVQFIDFKKLWMNPDPSFFTDDYFHLTEQGCGRLAEDLLEEIVNFGALKIFNNSKEKGEKDADFPLRQSEEAERLFEAVRLGDAGEIKSIISGGVDVNSKDERGRTPLIEAAFQKNEKIAELLISEGAGVNEKDDGGWTPLHAAAFGGQSPLAELLINNGADVNAGDKFGMTPLHVATWLRFVETAELLISRGAEANASDEIGWTPLHYVARMDILKASDLIELLLSSGADINASDKIGCAPLAIAAEFGHEEISEILLNKGADVNARDNFGETPLHRAARFSHENQIELMDLLLSRGAEIDARDKHGLTPLHVAAIFNTKKIAEFLIENGANPGARDNNGRTPLDHARDWEYKEIIEILRGKK